jgi:hypothetical protein
LVLPVAIAIAFAIAITVSLPSPIVAVGNEGTLLCEKQWNGELTTPVGHHKRTNDK